MKRVLRKDYPREAKSHSCAKARCFNIRRSEYERYGGRGITMCDRYRKSFISFLGDIGPCPSAQHQLDRMDNNGHYSCGQCEQCLKNKWKMNVRWATQKQQCRNRRSNLLLTFNRETKLLIDWAVELGISMKRLSSRIKRGWSAEKALSVQPTRLRSPALVWQGQEMAMVDFARLIGLPLSTVKTRLTRGWSLEWIASTPSQICRLVEYKRRLAKV